jgi:hypothetical protein
MWSRGPLEEFISCCVIRNSFACKLMLLYMTNIVTMMIHDIAQRKFTEAIHIFTRISVCRINFNISLERAGFIALPTCS